MNIKIFFIWVCFVYNCFDSFRRIIGFCFFCIKSVWDFGYIVFWWYGCWFGVCFWGWFVWFWFVCGFFILGLKYMWVREFFFFLWLLVVFLNYILVLEIYVINRISLVVFRNRWKFFLFRKNEWRLFIFFLWLVLILFKLKICILYVL